MEDPVLEEMSRRCNRVLQSAMLVYDTIDDTPFKQRQLGRVLVHQRNSHILVCLFRTGQYSLTNDIVYSESNGRHIFSNWPLIYDALAILRIEMVLDDISSSDELPLP